MINSYKNAIHWSVDTFFKRLDEQADLSDTLVIYTSDHGQNLLDDGVPVTHCRADNPISEEAWVPLLVFSKDRGLASDLRKAARLNQNRASAFQIFPTILRVMGYDPVAVRRNHYPSLFDAVSEPVGFVSGGVFRMFGSKTTWNAFRFYGQAPAAR
jgi:glucan phosphoethanolaminetransferase (alkaline phosphatase superfamily)